MRGDPMPTGSSGRGPSMEPGVLELTWDVFGELCRALAVKVSHSGYRPDAVVGIAKAGVIPGAVIASILRSDFYSLKITRRGPGGDLRESPEILSAAPRQVRGQRVLIVDEICTSGETLRMATSAIRNVGPGEVRTATSIVKVGGFQPDYHALETEGTVIFPWDRQVIDDDGEVVTNPDYRGLL